MGILVLTLGVFLVWVGNGTGLSPVTHTICLVSGLILSISTFLLMIWLIITEDTHPRV